MSSTPQIESPEQLATMPEEYREALVHQMLAHAEGELVGVADYLDIMPVAPTAQEKKYCIEGARDEMEHYIVSAEVLAEIGVDTSYMLDEGPDERRYYPHEVLNLKRRVSWVERGLTSYLAERAALDIIEEMAESSYRPWAAIMPKIISEEIGHFEHGRRITAGHCADPETRQMVQRVLDKMWPQVLDMFGETNSKRTEIAVRWGLRQRSNEDARQHFSRRMRAMLSEMDLTAPEDHLGRKFM